MMKIETQLNCTPLEFLEDLANRIYQMQSGANRFPLSYFLDSEHPTEISCLKIAEDIFEMVTGNSPDYNDE